jgi:hypothetical protein
VAVSDSTGGSELFAARAVLGGALTALITSGMALVAALAIGGVLDWSKGAKTLVATIGAIAGFVLGGFRAGLLQPPAPLSNGAAAAVVAYVPLGILQRLLAGTGIRVLNLIFASLLAASFGVFGGFVANNANRTRAAGRR